MAVRAAHPVAGGVASRSWSLAALALATAGVAVSAWVILGSEGDSSDVRWPLVAAPVAVCLVPVLVSRRGARIGTALALGGWCVLAAASIGSTQVLALCALFGALLTEGG